MNIALIAHDNKKELMVQFCTAYCGILAQHTLCATARTGQLVSETTGLPIHRFLTFEHGGDLLSAARQRGAPSAASAPRQDCGKTASERGWKHPRRAPRNRSTRGPLCGLNLGGTTKR